MSRFFAQLQPANDNYHTGGSLPGIRGILSKMRDVYIAVPTSLPYAGIQKNRLPEMVWGDLCRHPLIQLYRRMA